MKMLLILSLATTLVAQERHLSLPSGAFVECKALPEGEFGFTGYTLAWGDKNVKRDYPDTIFTRYGMNPKIIGENGAFLVIEISPVNNYSFALILPLDKSGRVLKFEYPLGYDLGRDLIAYCDDRGVGNDSALAVENFYTHRKQLFLAEGCHEFAFDLACLSIFKAEFQGDSLYYEWQIQDPKSRAPMSLIKSRTGALIKFTSVR